MTFSIVARSEDGQSWGVAVASKFLAVGSPVPAAIAGIGAIATQAMGNVAYKGMALAHMDEGANAEVALARLLEDDELREHRQVGLVDSDGNAATYTGSECFDWAGGETGPGVALQGNILAGPQVVPAMRQAWDDSVDRHSLARRLLAALSAGDLAGGDRRGRQSVAILVVRDGAGYGGLDDVAVDLRVDDHPDPCTEMERLLHLHELYMTASTEAEKVPVDRALRTELDQRARALGHSDFTTWVGTENYEMRAGDDWVDEKVLAILRAAEGRP
jgi:uncharacterized Ntn-hydrolase superfamily protein